ncbi:MAG: DUF3488 and transglutaminase-like domain-containing protein [Cyanobacteriota bacterium]|nr:DUF3488 and transglutaminase-like domain-containing protein [Cyanobacteriota bacterium]
MGWTLFKLQKISIYVLVGIAFLANWLGGTFILPIALVLLAAGCFSWFWEPPRIDFNQWAGIWMPLTVSMLVVLAGLAITSILGPFDAGIGLVLYLTTAKLFQRERAADYIQTTVLSFLLMSIATIFNEDISFGLLFMGYVIVGLICLTLYHLRIQTELYPQAARQNRRIQPKLLGLLVSLAVIALVASIAFFFLFPRVGFGFLAQQTQPAVNTTGFSEEVNLGSFGTLKSDPTVVMRVEFPNGIPIGTQNLYWRGISFDRYDGSRWSRTLYGNDILFLDSQGRVDLPPPQTRDPQAASIRQSIYLEPLSSNVLFALHPVLNLQLEDRRNPNALNPQQRQRWQLTRRIGVSETGDITHQSARNVAYQYQATSEQPQWSAQALRQISHQAVLDSLEPQQRQAYLQLPDNLSPAIADLAAEITQGIPDDYDRVLAIQNYLLQNYTYTTDLPDPGDNPPLDSFLFVNRRGHCEYFSTALAILTRSVGIPTRSVNGFLGGRWNERESYLSVRNADAHSWTEIPFGSYGWVTFDATPAVANVSAQENWLDPLRSFYDALRFRWIKYVIQYDLQTQLALLEQLQTNLPGSPASSSTEKTSWTDWLKSGLLPLRDLLRQNWLPTLGILVSSVIAGWRGQGRRLQRVRIADMGVILALSAMNGALLLGLWQPRPTGLALGIPILLPSLLFALMRWQGWQRSSHRQMQEISRLYVQVRRHAIAVGIPVQPRQGPEALITLLQSSHLSETEPGIRLIRRYLEVRFGQQPLATGELRQLWQEWQQVRQAWSR